MACLKGEDVSSQHVAALAWYAALLVAGGLLSGPIWMHYERRCAKDEREWEARRRERQLRVTLDRRALPLDIHQLDGEERR